MAIGAPVRLPGEMRPPGAYKILCLVLALGLALLLLGSPANDIFKYNEVIWIDFFVRDLFSGYHFKWWNVAWNPYFFPDALVYLLLYPIPDTGVRLGCYALAMAAGLTGFTAGIVRRLSGKDFWPVLTFVLAACTFFVLVFYRTAILDYTLIPVFHGGSAVLGLGALYLALGQIYGPRPVRSLWLLFAVILAGVFSDGVLLYSYLVPILLTLCLLALFRIGEIRGLARLFLAVAAAAALGYTLRDAANRFGWFAIDQKVPLTLEFFRTRLTAFLGEHFGQFLQGGLSATGLGVLLVAALAPFASVVLHGGKTVPASAAQTGRAMLALFTALAPIFTGLFYVVFIDREIMMFRALAIVIVPFFLGAAWIMASGGPGDRVKIALLVLACLAVAFLRRDELVLGPRGHLKDHAEFTGAFDAVAGPYCLRRGFARPELAKHLTLFTQTPVWINQITDSFAPHHYVDNLEWYVFEKGERCRRYDFIIEPPDMAPKLLDAFGEPRARLPYRGYEIWVYDRESDLSFRNVMKSRILAALGRSDLISLPVIRELRRQQANGTPCRAETCVYVPPGPGLAIAFAPPADHDVLEIALAEDAAYVLTVQNDRDEVVQSIDVPRVSGNAALRTHYYKLGEKGRSGPVKTVTVMTQNGQGKFAVGQASVYDDCPGAGPREAACATP